MNNSIALTARRVPLVLVLTLLATAGHAARYSFVSGSKHTEVTFESKAPAETVRGSTREIQGMVELDPAALADSITVEITVNLASLDTGIDLRNQHMRENHLHTDEYPVVVFRGARLHDAPAKLVPEEPVTVEARGFLTLHGVTRELSCPVELTLGEEERTLRVRAEFFVMLADFAIPRPKVLFLKLDEKQRIVFDAVAEAP